MTRKNKKNDAPRIRPAVEETVRVSGEITRGQILKFSGVAGSGGEAKTLIDGGDVQVNGTVEQRRGRKLAPGDVVEVGGRRLLVAQV
jgi:ribosome-associated protein